MTNIEIVPTTPEHMIQMAGVNPPLTVKAITAIRDGKVLGVAGVCRIGLRWVLFCELTEDIKNDKRAMVTSLRAVRKLVSSLTLPVIAIPQIGDSSLIDHVEGVQRWPS